MREPLVSRGEVDRLLLCRRGAWLKVAIFWLLFDIRLTDFGYPPIAGPQLIWATTSRDQSSMRSSSMRFAPHSPESQGAWDELYNARPAERVSRSPHSRDYFFDSLRTHSWLSEEAGCPINLSGTEGLELCRASRAATARRWNSA